MGSFEGVCIDNAAADTDFCLSPHLSSKYKHRAGLEQLAEFDPRFSSYRSTLFRADGTRFNRDALTAEQIKDLNTVIEGFLGLLSPFFLQPAAFTVLEYLLRRYR